MKKINVTEFIKVTGPDEEGKTFLDGELIAECDEVLCDSRNKELVVKYERDEEDLVWFDEREAICVVCYSKGVS